MVEYSKSELKEILEELEKHKGRATELITVYIPAGQNIYTVANQLEAEKSTAKNIKSTGTRKNVGNALDKITRHLKEYKKTPENGLAIFCGNVSKSEGQDDLQLWDIEPPEQMKIRMYRCDKEFVIDPLKEMLEVQEVFGLLVMDRKEATIGLLEGKRIELLHNMNSGIPSKVRAGGQCHPAGTLIQMDNGLIPKIEEVHNLMVAKSINGLDIGRLSFEGSPIKSKWNVNKKEIFKIKTIFPQLIVESSGDHVFFVVNSDRIIEKAAEELKIGDVLIMPEKIDVQGERYKINSKLYYNSFMLTDSGRDLVRNKRNELGLSQKKLAEIMNSVQTVVSYYEIGRQNARRDFLLRLCEGLDIDFIDFINNCTEPLHYRDTKIKLPNELDAVFAQFLGYLIGDGCIEKDRITFFEQRKEVAFKYKEIYNLYFNLNSSYRFRKNKNYHQLRFTSRPLVNLIKSEFPEVKKTFDSEVPEKILKSDDSVVAGFLKGIFDAEGYVVYDSVGIASSNKTFIGQILLLLLRFSIISSFQEYDNKKNPYTDKPIFKLQINEKQSLENFRKYIDFISSEKGDKLNKLIDAKSDKSSVRQIIFSGKKIAEIIKKRGHSLRKFGASSFFTNKRNMGKKAFENSILKRVREDKDLYNQLKNICDSPLLPVKISKIDKRLDNIEMVDLEVENKNFFANGILVHNSSQRYHRITEGLTKEFYKKIAEEMKKSFFELPRLKGIIIGGPIPTKDEFIDGEYLTAQLRNKVMGKIDIGDSSESGLKELVEKSQDLLLNHERTQERKEVENLFRNLGENPDKTFLDEGKIKRALEMGAVETIFFSEGFPKSKIKEFSKTAESMGTNIKIISNEISEGEQFFNMGGIAAILRFRV